ncbi:vWA domain-containing protein [Gilvimarinus xylanilyticus]|uniref:VWA domain-containing protein n=1 Tax=Gilvimarinus xylanilyticus TaxID=2944139 RepID=A0A9X2HXV3_9GAMM|nr:vWA domain-containing protein [Gilvimarinus xylanilyticus]MCP8899034.1 VWA domain-containing protein [Gilvimarinus xylanilyticus]
MRVYRVVAWFTLVLFAASTLSAEPEPQSGADVRLLVDVSGSMQGNDPNGLRREAIALIVKLLDSDSHAGVWTFGSDVKLQVPFAPTEQNWQSLALEQVSAIHARGLYTPIGDALRQASRMSPQSSRSDIILLTDGKVDVSQDAKANARERQTILTELLPSLKTQHFRIHTIALSDDADTQLLSSLSRATDGLFVVAHSAAELMQAYLQILDQAVVRERLPLEGNEFHVDSRVQELTALVFRPNPGRGTRLQQPDGQVLSQSQPGDHTRWHSADGYDLITVSDPATGRWEVLGQAHEQNRITLLSDLRVRLAPLPSHLPAGEPLVFKFCYTDSGEVLADPAFLKLVRSRLQAKREDGAWRTATGSAVTDSRGCLRQELTGLVEPGLYQVRLLIDGKTFSRELRHSVRVESLFGVQLERHMRDGQVSYTVRVTPQHATIDKQTSAVVAHVHDSNGDSSMRAMDLTEAGYWQLEFIPDKPARTVIELEASGTQLDGTEFTQALPTQYVRYPTVDDPVLDASDPEVLALEQQLARERAALEAERKAFAAQQTHQSSSQASSAALAVNRAAPAAEPKDSGLGWWTIAAITIANIALAAALYWLYRRFRKSDVQSELDDIEQQLQSGEAAAEESADVPQVEDPMIELDDLQADVDDLLPMDEIDNGSADKDAK